MNSGLPGNIFFYIPILLLFCWLIYWSLLHQLILRCGWLIDLFGGASTALSMQEHKTDITKKKVPFRVLPALESSKQTNWGGMENIFFSIKKPVDVCWRLPSCSALDRQIGKTERCSITDRRLSLRLIQAALCGAKGSRKVAERGRWISIVTVRPSP